jgi:hypothetical protein
MLNVHSLTLLAEAYLINDDNPDCEGLFDRIRQELEAWQRLIEGWTGRSITNRTLIRAFGVEGRTAGAKSLDFEKLEELIEPYGPNVRKALLKD